MNNLYYYTFYLMVKMIKWLNKKDATPDFGGVMMLSSTMFFNVFSLLILLSMALPNSWTTELLHVINLYATCLGIMTVAVVLNYLILMYDHKSDRILAFFNEKFEGEKQNNVKVALIIAYNVLSIIGGIYLAHLLRSNKI